MLLATLLLSGTPGPATTKAATTLGFALVASVGNWLLLEPVATKLMFERWVNSWHLANGNVTPEHLKLQIVVKMTNLQADSNLTANWAG